MHTPTQGGRGNDDDDEEDESEAEDEVSPYVQREPYHWALSSAGLL